VDRDACALPEESMGSRTIIGAVLRREGHGRVEELREERPGDGDAGRKTWLKVAPPSVERRTPAVGGRAAEDRRPGTRRRRWSRAAKGVRLDLGGVLGVGVVYGSV